MKVKCIKTESNLFTLNKFYCLITVNDFHTLVDNGGNYFWIYKNTDNTFQFNDYKFIVVTRQDKLKRILYES
jgi:hypothetical protein